MSAANWRPAIENSPCAAQFFEALSKFQGELRPDAAPQIVLQAIAQTAIGVLAVPCAAVFSLPPGHSYAEMLLCDSDGHVFPTSLVDLPTNQPGLKANEPLDDSTELAQALGPAHVTATYVRPPVSRAGDGPVLIAGEELEWFVATVSPRLGNEKRFWICLEADGHCVGGVVWGAEAAEVQRLSPQLQELATIAAGWVLALRTAQIREEALALSEQLAEANRQLQNAQTEILRSRTLISVGEMAAGAAHEMNNPLAVISGRSQLLAQQLTDAKFKASAQLIYEQSHRLSAIITDLMEFARPECR